MKSPPAAPAAGAYSAVSRKLMASMGWSEGKGLGKHEQGAERHVEHKKRGDNVGLGADATVEAQFAAGLHKGSAKAAFGDQGWVDAFAGALDSMNDRHGSKKKKKKTKKTKQAKKDAAENFLDECFAATGGARLGMRAQRSGGGKLRRAEAAAPPAKRARADETPEERRERKLRKKRRREAKKAAAEAL